MLKKVAPWSVSYIFSRAFVSLTATHPIMKPSDAGDLLTKEVTAHRTPSAYYCFFDVRVPLYNFHVGMADIRNQQAVSENSVFPIYSVTKTFTALAILHLEELGLINIDHAASRYLNDFPFQEEITIRQLLNHSSGIPNPLPLNWIHLAHEHATFDASEFFDNIFARSKMMSPPGQRFNYSNLGYVLLGRLIENVTRMPYEKFITDTIFGKLSLDARDIGFTIPKGETHVRGYQKNRSLTNLLLAVLIDKRKYMGTTEGLWKPFHDFYVNGSSYGGIYASPRAMMIYLQQLLRSDIVLLRDEQKMKMFQENYLNRRRPTGMCLSWFKGSLKGVPYYTHAGGGGGFYCEVRLYPTKEKGSLVMFNRTGLRDERFLDKPDSYFL